MIYKRYFYYVGNLDFRFTSFHCNHIDILQSYGYAQWVLSLNKNSILKLTLIKIHPLLLNVATDLFCCT